MNALLDLVGENRLLGCWAEHLSRSPRQLNSMHESDAELIALPGSDRLLAVTIDTIAEEIALGFYRSAETIGWMGVVASLSDLAAVASEPIGVVISVSLPDGAGSDFQEGVARGIDAACRAADTFVLGGDTNHGAAASITCCALGTVDRRSVLRRTGAEAGDVVYATGLLGAGAARAAAAVVDLPIEPCAESAYRPRARLRACRHLAPFVSAAMDTSDGLLATLDQLGRLNGIGFDIDTPPADLLVPDARQVAEALAVPYPVMLAVHHGEYEVVLTVPQAACARFEAAAEAAGCAAVRVGRATSSRGLRIGGREIDGAHIRNLAEGAAADLPDYLRQLVASLS